MKKILTTLLFFTALNLSSQEIYISPLDIPLVLSANFGELRPNHFHSGLDLKTQGVVNKPVSSIEDGYVSRISISPSGYGLAIYINHTTGKTSVYGHLNSFAPKIAEYVKEQQYIQERFNINIILDEKQFPVKKGDLIAYSGNTGSSFGPHVHFEIRDTERSNALDPLLYYKTAIKDTQSPLVKGIAVYPIQGEGVVNNSDLPLYENVILEKKGGYAPIKKTIDAWGKIGLGIHAIDKMDGTHNVYGVKNVRMFCDGKEVFSTDISFIDFSQTRMINSFIDFDYWYKKKAYYMKSFIEPGNKLPIYQSIDNGYININEERTYNIRYELKDLYGNTTIYKFAIAGKKQNIPQQQACSQAMVWDRDNHYITESFSLVIPKEYLYADICFSLTKTISDKHFSPIYTVHNSHIPLNSYCDMKIKLSKDSLANKSQYGIVRIDNAKEYWVGGKYNNGYITAPIRELGNSYAVSFDNIAPTITPLLPAKWVSQKKINIKVVDNKSGVKTYRGTIDGEYVLFEHDNKSTTYSYTFDAKRLKKGQKHTLVFSATDACGNTSSYKYEFTY